MYQALDFLVDKKTLRAVRFAPGKVVSAESSLQQGQILMKVDAFALTSNNVTYGVLGETLSYWSFFPAPEGWGCIPVWGFADVALSRHPEVAEGARFFGYFPMSTHVVMEPDRIKPAGFVDSIPHRRNLPAIYNAYTRTLADPAYVESREGEQMLFRPLFASAFLIDDYLAESAFFGAKTVVISSASSRTAYALAFLLARRGATCDVVGLTSQANAPFVESLGFYGRVVTYDALASLPSDHAVVYVDLSGDAALRANVHRHFRDGVRHSCLVGGTHWEKRMMTISTEELPGAAPTPFVGPKQLGQRLSEWGREGFQRRVGEASTTFVDAVSRSTRIVRGRGPADVERIYRRALAGQARPAEGTALSAAPPSCTSRR